MTAVSHAMVMSIAEDDEEDADEEQGDETMDLQSANNTEGLTGEESGVEETDEHRRSRSLKKHRPVITRKVSIVTNEGSRRSFMKGALVLKPEKIKPEAVIVRDEEDKDSNSSHSQGSSSSDDDDDYSIGHDGSSSEEDAMQMDASKAYSSLLKDKTLKFHFLSESVVSDESLLHSPDEYEGARILPMFDAQINVNPSSNRYPLLLQGIIHLLTVMHTYLMKCFNKIIMRVVCRLQ